MIESRTVGTEVTDTSVPLTVTEMETNYAGAANNLNIEPEVDDQGFPASTSPCLNAGTVPLSKFDAYSRPNWGNHIGAVWPRINTNKKRRAF